jgi:hypothetical protein
MNLNLLNISTDLDKIKAIWSQLSSDSNSSYFLSWGWIENWITSLADDHQLWLGVISEKEIPQVAFFLGETRVIRNNVFRSCGLFLNTTGIPLYDSLCIEYNAMIYSNPLECSFKQVLDLLPRRWDEFFMPGLDSYSFPGNCLDEPILPYHIVIEGEDKSYYVNLELVRKTEGGYLSLLSSNTRAQIRRSYRGFESKGRVTAEVAMDLADAMNIYEEMVELHQKTWLARGKTGAFEADYFRNFHEELIRKRIDHGEIQLLRIKCGNLTVGCLYNFAFKGRVYFYQSGINYEIGSDLKPGLVCHVEAIRINTELGHLFYDFLAGSDRYKLSLATNQARLIWAKVQKPSPQFWLENKMRSMKRSIQKSFEKRDQSA